MSRAKKLSDVNFSYSSKQFINEDVSEGQNLKIVVSNDIDEKYMTGKIYKISFDDNIYIGSTYRTLEERFQEHKKAKKGSEFIETLKGHSDAIIELVKDYPCVSLNELVAEEMRILEEHINNSDGFNVLNTIGNRKKKVQQTEIKMERLEKINIVEKEQYQIIENIKQNLLRVQVVVNEKKLDVKVSMNKRTKDEATAIIKEKVEKMIANEKLVITKGKCILDWS